MKDNNQETEPRLWPPALPKLRGLTGDVTIRAGNGFRPIISRKGTAKGTLISVSGSQSAEGEESAKLRIKGISFVDFDGNGAKHKDPHNQPYYRILVASNASVTADQCVFIE